MLKVKRFLDYKKCSFCGNEFIGHTLEKINKVDYICFECKSTKFYSMRNTKCKGKVKDISYSFEFETDRNDNSLYELKKYGFIGCSDCTIGGQEWKSQIYYSRKSFHHICKYLDKFKKFVGPRCGTHLHVSTNYKELIRKYEVKIFLPILNEMKSNMPKTIKFWGRCFNSYCRGEIGNTRYNVFNTRSSVETLEYRLLKFINAEQYIRACDFCIDTTKFINDFIKNNGLDEEKAKRIGTIILKKYKEVIKDV